MSTGTTEPLMTDWELARQTMQERLDADDAQGAFDAISSLKFEDLKKATGFAFYGMTKGRALVALRRSLENSTASARRKAERDHDIALRRREIREKQEHLDSARRLLAEGQIAADSTAFQDGSGRLMEEVIAELRAQLHADYPDLPA